MKCIFTLSACLLIELIASTSHAQLKKVTILGSSTAAGNGASVPDSSWVKKLQASFRLNTTDGADTIIDNRAVPGYVTYKSLPTDTVISGKPAPDPNANITYVLNSSPRPDIVIISYPNNDIATGYDPRDMMNNLRYLFNQLNANGITCFISSSQPRNDLSDPQRTILKQLLDSVNLNFSIYAIDFWDDLVSNDGLNKLSDAVNSGDDVHPNNLGHRLLFQSVQAKNIFAPAGTLLPLFLKNWEARLQNNMVKLSWSTTQEEANASFEIQRSKNGKDFQAIYQTNGLGGNADYTWTDASPSAGKNFYRLKFNEDGKTHYSRIIPIVNDKKQLLTSFYADASQLHLQLNNNRSKTGMLTIINYSGAIVKKQSFNLTGQNTIITVPVFELSSGNYILKVTVSDGTTAIERFTLMK